MGAVRCAFVVPGRLRRSSGGNLYDRMVADALRRRGWSVDVVEPADPIDADVAVVDSLAFRHGPPATEVPMVALAHQLPSRVAGQPSWAGAERELLRASRLVVTVAEWLRTELEGLTDAPVEVVTPGTDRASNPNGPAPDADLVISVGNAVTGKGMPEAVDAFLRADLDGAGMAVAGDLTWDTAEAERLEAVAARGEGRVRVAGAIGPGDLRALYRRSRIFLSASTYEGWPIGVAEAMASGVAVLGCAIPGMDEVAGPDAVLVPPGDVRRLAEELSSLWANPDRSRDLGERGRHRATRWPTWAETGERFADLLDDVLATSSG
jgi:glycosyltransferase involved in cell wall biosynthesis